MPGSLHILVTSFLFFSSLDFLYIRFLSCLSCLAKCKQRLCNIFVFCNFIAKIEEKRKTEMEWNKHLITGPLLILMSHWRHRTTECVEFWITCKQLAFLSSFSRLRVIQNKRPWCSAAAYVTAGCLWMSPLTWCPITLILWKPMQKKVSLRIFKSKRWIHFLQLLNGNWLLLSSS